ncbi:MAG: choice-of-anchor B family protein [Planctomycetota bacterium]
MGRSERKTQGSSAIPRLLMIIGALAVGVTASAHDEDWRKLADQLPRIEGPIFSAASPLTPSNLQANAAAASGITLLSQVPLNNFAGNQVTGNDCWGYTSPFGREYAILGLSSGFGFVEITDPTNPVVIETIPGPASTWHDVKVIGQYAYGVSEGGAGIQVMDLSQIDSGVVTLVQNSEVGGHSTTHNIVSNEEAGTLYLAGANIGNGGLIRLDLTDPVAPQIVGGWTDMYVHDAQVVTWKSGPLAGREIAFCAAGFDGGQTETGLRVVDMTDPTSPVLLDTLFYPDAGYAHQVWVGEDQQTLYLNDELDELRGNVTQTTTRIIDVTDPTNLVFEGTFSTGLPATDHNLYVHNGLIYQANYRSGLRVFDASDPLSPVEVRFFDTFPGDDAVNFNGAWSVYPFFDSGTIIVSDIERGLFVLRLDVAQQPALRLTAAAGLPLLVSAAGGDTAAINISEIQTALDPQTVEMVVTDAAGELRIEGISNGDGAFVFTLPAVACGAELTYYFEAATTEGDVFTLPADPQASQFSATPFTAMPVILDEPFDAPTGWVVSGDATDGQWTVGVPVDAGRADPAADADGSGSAFLTDNDASNGGNSDVDNGATILTSPPIDLAPSSTVEYAYWFNDTSLGPIQGGDSFEVRVSSDNGASYTTVRSYTTAANAWRSDSLSEGIDYSASASGEGRLQFVVTDIGTQNIIEGGIDALRITALQCETPQIPACGVGDVTTTGATLVGQPGFGQPDGIVDLDDLGYYLLFWLDGDLSVDLTTTSATLPGQPGFGQPDGSVDIDDLGFFLNAWLLGCP